MRVFILSIFILAISVANAYSQKKAKDTSTVLVYVEGQKAYQSIKMQENQITLDVFPEVMRVVFPVNFWEYDIVIMNGDDSTIFSSACKPGDTTCKTINWAKSNNYTIDFQFHKNILTSIGGQMVYVELAAKKPVIKFVDKTTVVNTGVKQKEKADDKKVVATDAKPDKYDALKVGDASSKWIDPDDSTIKEIFFYTKRDLCKECDNNIDKDCFKSVIPSLYNQVFMKPCLQANDRYNSSASTLKYRVVIDDRANIDKNKERVTYLKLKNRKGYEYYRVKKRINPMASYELEIQVLGNEDSAYNIQIDNGRNYFLAEQSNFAEAIGKINGTVQTPDTAATNTNKNNTSKIDESLEIVDSVDKDKILTDTSLTPAKLASSTAVRELSYKFVNGNNLSPYLQDTTEAYIESLKKTHKNITNDNLALFKAYIVSQDIILKTGLDAKLHNGLIAQLINYYSSKNVDKTKRQELERSLKALLPNSIETSKPKESPAKLLVNLLALSKDIKQFHHDYYNIDYRINEWARDITALRKKITDVFHITVTSNEADLASSLIRLVKYNVDSCYYNEFSAVIKTIEQQYKTISQQKTTTKIYSKQFSVPNADAFNAIVNYANKEAKNVFKKEFNVSAGFQIDFSSGLFVNGIKNFDYSLIPTTFKYRNTSGDTTEATGNIIYKKGGSNITYGTGFLLHAYTRTGEFYNGGLSTGVMFDNSSNFSLLLGASLLLNTGISRVAFTGGICWGQQKKISDYASQYLRPSDTTTTVYPSLNAVPKFYQFASAETNTNWVHSWFFGITFNFASISPNSKTTLQ